MLFQSLLTDVPSISSIGTKDVNFPPLNYSLVQQGSWQQYRCLSCNINNTQVAAFSSHSAPLNTSRTPDTEGDKWEESELAVSESRLVVKLVSASLPSRIVVR